VSLGSSGKVRSLDFFVSFFIKEKKKEEKIRFALIFLIIKT